MVRNPTKTKEQNVSETMAKKSGDLFEIFEKSMHAKGLKVPTIPAHVHFFQFIMQGAPHEEALRAVLTRPDAPYQSLEDVLSLARDLLPTPTPQLKIK